jgi:hypothetical protein
MKVNPIRVKMKDRCTIEPVIRPVWSSLEYDTWIVSYHYYIILYQNQRFNLKWLLVYGNFHAPVNATFAHVTFDK